MNNKFCAKTKVKPHHSYGTPLSGFVDVYSVFVSDTVAPGGIAWRWRGPQNLVTEARFVLPPKGRFRVYFCDQKTRAKVPVVCRHPLLRACDAWHMLLTFLHPLPNGPGQDVALMFVDHLSVWGWGFTADLSELLIYHQFYTGRSLLTLVSRKHQRPSV